MTIGYLSCFLQRTLYRVAIYVKCCVYRVYGKSRLTLVCVSSIQQSELAEREIRKWDGAFEHMSSIFSKIVNMM